MFEELTSNVVLLELAFVVATLACIDSLNVANAKMNSYLLFDKRKLHFSLAYATGLLLAYLLCAVPLYFWAVFLSNQVVVETIVLFVFGVLFVKIAYPLTKRPKERRLSEFFTEDSWAVFKYGFQSRFFAIPLAIPFFIVMEEVHSAAAEPKWILASFVFYNLTYLAPLIAVVTIQLIYSKFPPRSFHRFADQLIRFSAFLGPVILFLIGGFMVLQASFRLLDYLSGNYLSNFTDQLIGI
ncbi:MAG: hypothetical protein GXP16_18465 [Gammaproteobacteria bacterium]|nr:hypothetical protein [Gammaproteobacteria bacterium]